MILPRVITAIFGIPIIIGVIYFGSIPFFLFVLFVIVASNWEYYLMMKTSLKSPEPYTLFFTSFMIPTSFFLSSSEINTPFILLIIAFSVILPFSVEIFRDNKSLERIAYTYIGIFFISYTLSHFILIREIPHYGRFLVYLLFISVWICDTFAYFIGKSFGRNKLSTVSPKKTIEGFFAGLLSVVAFYYLISKQYDFMTSWQFIFLAILVGIAGQYSDLAQSLIKRVCGVKDSSNLLPGHGGVFDRFDSYLFLSPLFYYFYILVK
ncbi:MAG: phosphatidate cytidylyltransferase [Elusimicrobiales bacterium]|nr:phosphatidate cytidylyltransferase [Elusimicrobiales bacterium]